MQDLKTRTFKFAVEVGKLIAELPFNTINKAYSAQLIRCSSSVGANYRAAKRAKSDADFINKLKIVIYFLDLLREFNGQLSERIDQLIKEADELLRIIVRSITTTREKIHNNKPRIE